MPSMTLTFDPTDANEVRTVVHLIELVRDVNESSHRETVFSDDDIESPTEVALTVQAKEAVAALWPRLGSKLRVFMIAAAELTREQGEYTVPELADRLGERDRVVVSWRANLGRSLKAIAKDVPQAPPFFRDRFDEDSNAYRYSMTPVIVDAVLSKGANG